MVRWWAQEWGAARPAATARPWAHPSESDSVQESAPRREVPPVGQRAVVAPLVPAVSESALASALALALRSVQPPEGYAPGSGQASAACGRPAARWTPPEASGPD